jgi:hypothetical protein
MSTETQLMREALDAFDVFCDADDLPSLLELTKKMDAIRERLTQPAQPAPTTLTWAPNGERMFTAQQVADACMAAEIPDSKCESLLLELRA